MAKKTEQPEKPILEQIREIVEQLAANTGEMGRLAGENSQLLGQLLLLQHQQEFAELKKQLQQ